MKKVRLRELKKGEMFVWFGMTWLVSAESDNIPWGNILAERCCDGELYHFSEKRLVERIGF